MDFDTSLQICNGDLCLPVDVERVAFEDLWSVPFEDLLELAILELSLDALVAEVFAELCC